MSVLPVGFGSSLGGYQIERSLRFNSADNAFLNRTPASAGNRKTWTWSGWVKRSKLGAQQGLIGCSVGTSDSTYMNLQFHGGDFLGLGLYTQYVLLTTQVFRDASAWYHIVVSFDTTNATANNRCRMYVNGAEITTFTTRNNPTLNADYGINAASQHDIGRSEYTNSTCLGGYLTEVNFIDGQALTPSSFGETDSATGVWKPKAYSGTYGTNGFYLKFADNSGTTSTTLGKDSSGNGNNWTPNNFSVTAGAGNDSLVDSPTSYGTDTCVGGEVRGNYCTLNPLSSIGSTLSNGNLDCVTATSGGNGGRGTLAVSSGKWYWEFTPTVNGGQSFSGIALTTTAAESYYVAYYANTGNKFIIGSGSSSYGSTYTTNDVIGVALDLDSGTKTVTFYKNNVSQGAITITPSDSVLPIVDDGSGSATVTFSCNFGQRAFAYTAPSGFKALCTTNLPTPTIGATSTTQAGKYFDIVLYQAATTNGTFTRGNLSFRPDFTWIKNRDNVERNFLIDVVRGNTNITDKFLVSNSTAAEGANAVAGTTFSVTDTGYEFVETTINSDELFFNNRTYVGWNWKANGAGSSNTSGTITSTVSANTTSGFSIVTYTGNGTAGATVGHGLGVVPSMVIVKQRNGVRDWFVKHISLSSSNNVLLSTTSAQFNASTAVAGGGIADLSSSTTISFLTGTGGAGSYLDNVCGGGGTYVAYCFAPVAGYSAFGSYTGNGSADGPFVYLGFRPRFVLMKYTNTTSYWIIFDTARSTYNLVTAGLRPNDSAAENTNLFFIDVLSNGFKVRDGGGLNGSGDTTIYAAFAEFPFKFSLAR